MYGFNETIVALATPPGAGAIGVIRLSGKEAVSVADKIFKGRRLADQPGHTLHFGRIMDGETVLDEVVVSLYKAPRSYTGEDVIEISCHGSEYILQKIISLCTLNGAIVAKPGEFTQRAFLNGKLDLTQAEAVADLIASQSGAAHRAAMHNLRGGFRDELNEMREQLIQFSALMELELDFSEEDVEFADRSRFYELINQIKSATEKLLSSFSLGNAIRNGVSVAIAGKPNAGKSTLLNTFLNEERAIVSDIAGTTRDTIEETLNINGILFRLIDTAGIREHTSDLIEKIGVERSRKAMQQANIIVYLFDVNGDEKEVETELEVLKKENLRFIPVGNKTDQQGLHAAREKFYFLLDEKPLFISALQKDNIQELKDRLYELAVGGTLHSEGTVITNSRHYSALQEVHRSLQDILAGMDASLPGDLITLDIRHCLHYLGEITGKITTEDKLDYIFSKFCIGK